MGSYIVAAIGLAVIAASAAALTGGWTGTRFADPAPTVTEIVAAPEPTPNVVKVHTLWDIPAEGAPTVELTVTPDAATGYNIRIDTTNFTWAPEAVNTERVAGVGHAHIYVDGVKIGRLYGPDAHIEAGGPGSLFEVYLSANDHAEFSIAGDPIKASVTVAPAAPAPSPEPTTSPGE